MLKGLYMTILYNIVSIIYRIQNRCQIIKSVKNTPIKYVKSLKNIFTIEKIKVIPSVKINKIIKDTGKNNNAELILILINNIMINKAIIENNKFMKFEITNDSGNSSFGIYIFLINASAFIKDIVPL